MTKPAEKDTPPELVYFESQAKTRLIDFAELYQHLGLIWLFSLRDLKVRYRQTLVGVAWAVMQPLTTMVIFWTLFSLTGAKATTGEAPYPLVVLCGLLPWQLFANITSQSTISLAANQNLITKSYFPRLVLPLATVIPAIVDFAVSLVIVAIMVFFERIPITWSILLLPFFITIAIVIGLGLGILFAALNARYRDFGYIVPFMLQVGFFISPVVYSTETLIPSKWQPIYALNPLVFVIDGFRMALLGATGPAWPALAVSGPVVVALLVGALAYFRRVERTLADVI